MSKRQPVEAQIAALVQVRTREPGGPWFVELVDLLPEPVRLGPYDNPAGADYDAGKLRAFLAALKMASRAA